MVTQIVTTADIKAFLNIPTTDTSFDTQLGLFVDAASQMIVNRIGPVAGSPTYDEWYDGGSPSIVLRHTPVQSITSITESYGSSAVYTLTAQVLDSGSVGGAYGYSGDLSRGLLTRRVSGIATHFAAGLQNVHVVYVAGYATVPADIEQAAKLLIQHMWATQRGGSKRPGQGNDDIYVGLSFTWPRRVEEILSAYYIPGIA